MAVRLTNDKLSELKEAFMLFDYHKNGTIAGRDIGAVIRSTGLKPSESEVAAIRASAGSEDGSISLQTLVAQISQKVTHPTREKPSDMRDMFRMYDPQNTGYMATSDMIHLLTTIGEKLSEEEAEDLLRRCGCVEKGRVNYDKFLQTVMS